MWWSALGGQDAYAIPAVALFLYIGGLIYTGQLHKSVVPLGRQWCKWLTTPNGERWWRWTIIAHGLLFFATVVLKYDSFQLNTWDAGIYHNILFNISEGRFYSSFHQTHNFADHFTPFISFISLFYLINPSIHWMMGFKVLAYVLCPFLIYKIGKSLFLDKNYAKIVSFTLGFGWLCLYAPAVNSLNFEFQSSCLAPPVVLLAFFTLQKERWLCFTIAMLFLLGLKEHLGSVWIGMGLYLVVSTPRKKLGMALIAGGVLSLWLLIFQVMPYFRDYLPSQNTFIIPFAYIPQKFVYLFKLLLPFMFLPLFHWRYGIIAGPAIGVNLVSGRLSMVSSKYHYDDVTSALLFLATLLAMQHMPWRAWYERWKNRKSLQWGLWLWGIACLFLLPAGPLKPFLQAIPTNMHWALQADINTFHALSQTEPIAVQTALGPHFLREHISNLTQPPGGNCAEQPRSSPAHLAKYLILAPGINHYMIDDLQHCLATLEQSSSYRRLHQFRYLHVYENLTY
jgi:uncharacterized membrane protein